MSSGALNLDSDLAAGKAVLAEDETRLRRSNGIIPKVREQLRSADEDSYTPHSVPIGPYHRNRPSPWIVKEKLRYVGFMQCLSEERNGGGLNGLVEEMESRAREWYGDGVDHMTPEELARMLLHDGCYLLGWLVNYPDAPQTCNDNNTVFRDILYLIENQVPFFLLEDINRRATRTGDTSCLLQYMATYIQSLLKEVGYISKGKQRLSSEQPSHLLHLVHTYFHPTNGQMADPPKRPCQLLHRVHAYFSPTSFSPSADLQPAKRDTGRWRRATEYCMHANVQFRRRDLAADVTSILDVRLKGGTLDIPCLQVDSKTWTLLRNLMALEEHAEMPERPVTAYCIFMSQVACTVEDVRLLVDAKIVQHFQGSDKIAAQGFANLCKGVVMDVDDIQRNYLNPIWHDLEKLCDSPRVVLPRATRAAADPRPLKASSPVFPLPSPPPHGLRLAKLARIRRRRGYSVPGWLPWGWGLSRRLTALRPSAQVAGAWGRREDGGGCARAAARGGADPPDLIWIWVGWCSAHGCGQAAAGWIGAAWGPAAVIIKVAVLGFLSRQDEDLLDACPP